MEDYTMVAEDNLVMLSNGTTVNNERLKPSDTVLGWDGNKFVPSNITKIELSKPEFVYAVEVGNKTVTVAKENGFWLDGGVEIFADKLTPGVSMVYVKNGDSVKLEMVTDVTKLYNEETVYTICGTTYRNFVSNGIVLHNFDPVDAAQSGLLGANSHYIVKGGSYDPIADLEVTGRATLDAFNKAFGEAIGGSKVQWIQGYSKEGDVPATFGECKFAGIKGDSRDAVILRNILQRFKDAYAGLKNAQTEWNSTIYDKATILTRGKCKFKPLFEVKGANYTTDGTLTPKGEAFEVEVAAYSSMGGVEETMPEQFKLEIKENGLLEFTCDPSNSGANIYAGCKFLISPNAEGGWSDTILVTITGDQLITSGGEDIINLSLYESSPVIQGTVPATFGSDLQEIANRKNAAYDWGNPNGTPLSIKQTLGDEHYKITYKVLTKENTKALASKLRAYENAILEFKESVDAILTSLKIAPISTSRNRFGRTGWDARLIELNNYPVYDGESSDPTSSEAS